MNKFLIAGVMVATIFGAANAATKCVALDKTMVGDEGTLTGRYNSTTCDSITLENGVVVRMIGMLGNVALADGTRIGEPEYVFQVAENLNTNDSSKICWCKMIAPYEGKWVVLPVAYGAANIVCGGTYCASALTVPSGVEMFPGEGIYADDFRAALFFGQEPENKIPWN